MADSNDRPDGAPERLRAILLREHGVSIGPITASKIVDVFLHSEPVAAFEMSDRYRTAVLTWAQMGAIVQPELSLDGDATD